MKNSFLIFSFLFVLVVTIVSCQNESINNSQKNDQRLDQRNTVTDSINEDNELNKNSIEDPWDNPDKLVKLRSIKDVEVKELDGIKSWDWRGEARLEINGMLEGKVLTMAYDDFFKQLKIWYQDEKDGINQLYIKYEATSFLVANISGELNWGYTRPSCLPHKNEKSYTFNEVDLFGESLGRKLVISK